MSVKFFERSNPVAALLATVALFSIGFLIRPLGALLFGRIGDRVGRKYSFLVTLTGMGLSTALIGVVPITRPGRDRGLYPAPVVGDAGVPGPQGTGANRGQSLARGLIGARALRRA